MVTIAGLETYRRYLEAIEDEAAVRPASEYVDLLNQAEAIDLLCARDEIDEATLDPVEQRAVNQLDDLLLKYRALIVAHVPSVSDKPRARWWWHLHEGPQVRDEARRAA